MWSVPLALFGPDRDQIPGDLGDARFNNYVLEHYHRHAEGRPGSYWDAPFMHPRSNVIAHSDNLLGTAPLYHALRERGWERETALQLWVAALFALNYWITFGVLWHWTRRPWLAACGAFFFAFGLYGMPQMGNVQVLPRFMLPVGLYLLWAWLRTARPAWLLLATGALIYQFWCGVYLGFFLLLAYGLLAMAHVVMNWGHVKSLRPDRSWAWPLAALAILAAGLAPLMWPYMKVADTMGTRHFEEVAASIPHWRSLFFSHPSAISWLDLSRHGEAIPGFWCHYLFVGALPWLGILTAVAVLVLRKGAPADRHELAVLILAWALLLVVVMDYGGTSPWRFIHALPGFSALRSMDRVLHVQALFFLFVLVRTIMLLARLHRHVAPLLSLILPLALVLDNRINATALPRFNKHDSHAWVDQVARHLQRERDHRAVAYCPIREPLPAENEHQRTIALNLTAMLAAQQVGIPIVNAYTGSYPGNFISFFDHMDRRTLNDWCVFAGIDSSTIRVADNIGWPVASTYLLALRGPDGLFATADDAWERRMVMRGQETALWEVFRGIRLADGRLALIAHNGRFVRADLLGSRELIADAKDLGDHGLFSVREHEDGSWSLHAADGSAVVMDAGSRVLKALGTEAEPVRFLSAPAPGDVR